MEFFFNVKMPQEVLRIIDQFGPSGEEIVPLENSLGRILSRDLVSPEDLPGFFRSTMDGYAVRAKDTFGASESLPALLEVSGEVLTGEVPELRVGEGEAVKISTGGMIPEGTDGVVMIEYCHLLDDKALEVSRPISPLENVIQPDDDLKRGDILLRKGDRLRPQDLGVMAGVGQSLVNVFKKPRVAILSTGDEIVPLEESPQPGKVRDINRYTLGSFCRQFGADISYLGLCPDNFETLRGMIHEALSHSDMVWISGGSSVGTRDLTLKALETLPDFELLVHGISISPGKPTIIGKSGSHPVIGLPGHVSSALVVAHVFLSRLIFRLSGCENLSSHDQGRLIEAQLGRNIESASGREDYVRVKLIEREGNLIAEPIFGKSGLISTLVEADGLVPIPLNTEGLYKGKTVMVIPLR
jgi:molybdopterin molybdotransferase